MALPIKRRGGLLAVPTTSMGDIAFLLIIFFMLTSKFMAESSIKAENAKSPDINVVEDSNVSVVLDDAGEIWLQGKPCGTAEVMRMGVECLRGDRKDFKVMLRIHKTATQKQFGPVLEELGKAGVKIVPLGDKSTDYVSY